MRLIIDPIDANNAAFEGDELYMELGRILSGLAERISDGRSSGPLYDTNGNRVSAYRLATD